MATFNSDIISPQMEDPLLMPEEVNMANPPMQGLMPEQLTQLNDFSQGTDIMPMGESDQVEQVQTYGIPEEKLEEIR